MTLQISEFVFVAGQIGFSKGTRVTGMKLADQTGTAAGDLDLITVTATGVNIFVGIGGPYWNDSNGDQVIDGSDDPLAAGAKGLILSNVNLAIALLKPTAANSRKSYFAMKVTGNASIVGIEGLGFSATGLSVEVNSASDPTAATGTLPPVLNFQDKPLTVGSTIFNRANRFLGIHATVELTVSEVSIGATMDFEQTTRQNGTKVIKIALTNVDFAIGDPDDPTIEILDAEGLIFVTNLGMAAEFTVPVEFGDADEGFYFDGDLVVGINNTDQPVNEVFIVDQDRLDNDDDGTIDEAGESVTLNLQKGPYLKLAGNDITVQIDDFEVTGDFQFETITQGTTKLTRVAMLHVGVSFVDPDFGGLTLANGSGAFVFYPPGTAGPAGGVAGQLQGTFTVTATGAAFQAQATVILQINTTELDPAAATIVMENGQISFSIPRKTFAVTIRDLDVRIGDFFTLKGDFTTRTVTDALGERVIYGAANVTIFLGEGPYLLADNTVNPDAVGVVVKGAKVGVVKFTQGTADTADDRFAIYAYGTAELVGFPGLTVTGTLRVRVNNTGKAVNEIIELPGDAPRPTIPVQFASNTLTEVFEVGVDANGSLNPNAKLKIDLAGIFVIEGSFRITKLPTGRLDVEALTASVAINIPTSAGQLIEGIKLTGAVRFAMGGGLGFQMISFRVSGFAIGGVTIANAIPAPASQRRPIEADLASPFAGSNIKASDFEVGGIFSDGPGAAHIDVLFKDTNFVGIKADTIGVNDGAAEFVIGGAGAGNVIVNGLGVQVDPSNPNLFRYTITKADSTKPFFAADAVGGTRGTVEVTFLQNTFTDMQGATNGWDFETFYVVPIPPNPQTPVTASPVPTAMLLTPFNGTVVNAKTLNAKPWIDVIFMPGGAGTKVIGVTGNEIRILGAGASNIAVDQATGLLVGTPTEVAPNTWRYALSPKNAALPLFGNGQVTVEMLATTTPTGTTPTWCVVPLASTATTCDATTTNPGKTTATFTVDSTTITTAQAPTATSLGPLTIDGFTIGLASMAFKGGKLILTVGIEANEATLAFGGAAGAGNQTSSGIQATLTGILGTFDVAVDIAKAAAAISNPAKLLEAFDVTGKWSLSVTSLLVDVPNVVRVTAAGLKVGYDPNYDRATKGPQQILTLQSAQIQFPSFGITGTIAQHVEGRGRPTNPGPDDLGQRLPPRPCGADVQAGRHPAGAVGHRGRASRAPSRARRRPASCATSRARRPRRGRSSSAASSSSTTCASA